MAEYDLRVSKRRTCELYPVLVDAHGNVIDGLHRLKADPGWERRTLEHIRTPAQLWLARIVANTHRRTVSREERAEQLTGLAEALRDEGVPRAKIVSTIAELTTFSERYVRGLLPDDYKMMSKARFAEPSSSNGVEDSITVAEAAPRPPVSTGYEVATAIEDEASEDLGEDEDHYLSDTENTTTSTTSPKPAEEYVADYLGRHLKPDLDYLAWDVARRYGLNVSEAHSLIEEIQAEKRRPARPSPPRRADMEPGMPRTAICPLCCRSGADLNIVLMKMEALRASDSDLPAYRWIEEALKR